MTKKSYNNEPNLAKVANQALLQSKSVLRYQLCIFTADRKVFTRASYTSLPTVERLAAKAEGKAQIYDNVLRMRVGGQNLHRGAA